MAEDAARLCVWFLWSDLEGDDAVDGFVLLAPDETQARALPHAEARCGPECPGEGVRDEHLCPWRDPRRSTCELLGPAAPAHPGRRIVLRSYNPG